MKDLIAAAVQLIAVSSLLLVDVGGTALDREDLVPQLIGMLSNKAELSQR